MVTEIALKSRVNAPASRIREALREIPFDEFVAGHPLSPRALPRTDFFPRTGIGERFFGPNTCFRRMAPTSH